MPTPHDALFKRIFSDPRNAADELRAVLPPEAAAALDLDSLRLEPGSFVDDELRDRHTDLLFSVTLRGRKALVYVVFEHQSQSDPWMPLRLIRYVVRIWEAHLRAHPGAQKLPLVVPIVIQHDPDGWRAPPDLAGLVDLADDDPDREALEAFVPRFSYLLDDLTAIDPREIGARVMTTIAKMALSALRDVRGHHELETLVERWAELLRALSEPTELRAMDAIFRYILRARPRTEVDDLAGAFGLISADLSEQVMSTARQLIEQGLEQGREEGRRAVLLRLLRKRFGDVSGELLARVEAATPGEIDRWTDGLLEARSLEDLLMER